MPTLGSTAHREEVRMALSEYNAEDVDALVRMTAGCLEHPTLEEVDKMLTLMSSFPGSICEDDIKNGLLDLRTLLVRQAAA